MKKIFLDIVILCLVLAPLDSGAYGPFGKVKGTIKGIDGVLVGATITADNRTELTDQNGQFIFLLRPGTHLLTISHVGYRKLIKEIKINDVQDVITVDFVMESVSQLDEVVLLGSPSRIQRSNLNTPVPVDVFTYDNLLKTGRTGLTQMLNVMSPSLSSSRESIYESITLRGLNPDQTLILFNGIRYHNMAFIQADGIRGHIGKGSVANDINSIPFPAIDKVEILRDGGTSQYGSDAIAGVMDIVLKKSTGKTSVQLHLGEYYKGDGENISLGVYHGFKLYKKGFLALSADLRIRDHTLRGGSFDGTVYEQLPATAINPDSIRAADNAIIKARNFDRASVSNAGNSKLKSFSILMNGGYPLGKKSELFFTTSISGRKNTYLAAHVLPKNVAQVNTMLYPDGFRPRPTPFNQDLSGIAGLRGETKNDWRWEFTSSYGSNRGKYKIENTNNASQQSTLGINAPTEFYTGSLIYGQLINSINFVKEFSKKNDESKLLTLGWGAEWRMESYKIKAGEEAAWKDYDSTAPKLGGAQVALILRPEDEVNKTRNVLSTYIDLEAKLNKKLLINGSSRYEYYNDYGSNLAGKLAFRYKILDRFSLRGSFGNGFRAPSIQQRWYSATSNGYRRNGPPVPFTSGIFPNDSKTAIAFGVPSLGPEKSLNLSTGLTATIFDRVRLTVDAYWIQIKDRIVQSGEFDTANNKDVKYIILTNGLNVDRVQFFSNAINTRTKGIDIVMNSNWKIRNARLSAVLAANFTRTRIFGEIKVAKNLKPDALNSNTLFGRQERMKMEKGQPDHKIIFSLTYKTGKFEFIFRNTRFGNTSITANDLDSSYNPVWDEHFSSKILTDISINYSLKKWLTITGGANNVFNVYPDRIKNYINTGEGRYIYAMEASPFGFNGGYYYVSMSFNF